MTPLASERFESFTLEHAAIVVLFLAGSVVVVWLGHRHRETRTALVFCRVAAVVNFAAFAVQQVLLLLPNRWNLNVSLPIHLCDLVWPIAAWALWTRNPLATALVYFWGLTLTVQGILTPALGNVFPDLFYFIFWIQHFFIAWTALYLVFGLGVPISWRSYRMTVILTLVWGFAALGFNWIAGTNYGYLKRKPSSGSAFDLLGPWPLYVALSMGILMIVWAAMTWERQRHSHGRVASRRIEHLF